MSETAKLLIDGDWRGASDQGTATVLDPATGKGVGDYAVGTVDDMHAAIDAARRAFRGTDWAHAPKKRAAVLLAFADRLEANKRRLRSWWRSRMES